MKTENRLFTTHVESSVDRFQMDSFRSVSDNFWFEFVFEPCVLFHSSYNLALGFGASNYTLHAGTTHFRDFELGVHSRIHSKLEAGVQSNFSTSGGNALLGLGVKYDLDPTLSVKAKLDTVGQLGVSLTQELSKGVKLNLSSLINGYNLSSGEHRFGFGLELDI